MRKLRTLDNTSPGNVRAFKKSLKEVERYTKESVAETLQTIQAIVATSLKDADDCSLELQYDIQHKLTQLLIEPSKDGILTEADINKLLSPLAHKIHHLYDDFLFTEIDDYAPIRNMNLHKPLEPKMNHEIILNWLEIFKSMIEVANNELKYL